MPGLPARIQARLAVLYGVDDAPLVDAFIEASDDERETLFVREEGGELQVLLRLPRSVVDAAAHGPERARPSFDEVCQAVEGVSHFLYLAERARRELPATELELELQAEVDKFLLLSGADTGMSPDRAARARSRLFTGVRYLHEADTERGERYRVANDLAARFAHRLEATFASTGRASRSSQTTRAERLRATLRRFYGAGLSEKIELARAA